MSRYHSMQDTPLNELETTPEPRPPQGSAEPIAAPLEASVRVRTAAELREAVEHAESLCKALPAGTQRQRTYGLLGQLRKQLRTAEARETKDRLTALAHDAAALVGAGELTAAVERYRAVLAQTSEPVSPLVLAMLDLCTAALASALQQPAAAPGIEIPPEQSDPAWWQRGWAGKAEPEAEVPPPQPPPQPEFVNPWDVMQGRKAYQNYCWDRRFLHPVDLKPGGYADQQEAARAMAELRAQITNEAERLAYEKRYK